MAFIDLKSASPLEIVTQYVVDLRGSGLFLDRDESEALAKLLILYGGDHLRVLSLVEDFSLSRSDKIQASKKAFDVAKFCKFAAEKKHTGRSKDL